MCEFAEQKVMLFVSLTEKTFHKRKDCTRTGKDWKQEQELDWRERNEDKILFSYLKLPLRKDDGSICVAHFNV